MSAHTPGPWLAYPFKDGEIGRWRVIGVGRSGGYPGLCIVHPRPDADRAKANARLITAAPEMLELLQELVSIEDAQPGTQEWARKALAVITKATGAPA